MGLLHLRFQRRSLRIRNRCLPRLQLLGTDSGNEGTHRDNGRNTCACDWPCLHRNVDLHLQHYSIALRGDHDRLGHLGLDFLHHLRCRVENRRHRGYRSDRFHWLRRDLFLARCAQIWRSQISGRATSYRSPGRRGHSIPTHLVFDDQHWWGRSGQRSYHGRQFHLPPVLPTDHFYPAGRGDHGCDGSLHRCSSRDIAHNVTLQRSFAQRVYRKRPTEDGPLAR
mmetsp:Transcript_30973/g.82290  ORF Transcript_30973/g.82290 Transcript_30973/m.82290 type:complete len:224 (-) Transcript_30973:854-1525(-)